MPKHTLREILGIFAGGAGHTHEKAVQDTYDAGFEAGKAHQQSAEFQAGLASPSAGASSTGIDHETKKAPEGEDSKTDARAETKGKASKTE